MVAAMWSSVSARSRISGGARSARSGRTVNRPPGVDFGDPLQIGDPAADHALGREEHGEQGDDEGDQREDNA
jgi:hypothetical protein